MGTVSFSKWLAGALIGGVFAVTSASAATVTVDYQGSDVFGTPNLPQSVLISSPVIDGIVNAGPFRLTGDNGFGDFVAFCIDLGTYMKSGQTYTTSAFSAFGSVIDGYIDRLFTSAYAGVDTADEGAAFQIALWEIITDGGAAYNLGGGSFTADARDDVMNQANAYLAALAGAATGGYRLTFLNSGSSQDLVTVSAVPLPGAVGMLGLGLASFFGLRRRKKSLGIK